MNKPLHLKQILKAAILAPLFVANAYGATISSTFDIDAEGWLIAGDATSGAPTYVATGGNPGGFIQANDSVSGGVWYFDAPNMFLGDLSGALSQSLSFDLKQTGSGPQFNSSDVILNGGGLEVRFDAASNPLPVGDWVSYSVILDETVGWTKGGAAATQADMLTVLGSLSRLRIRGEFISGSDIGRLDNVSVQVVPVPAAIWLLISGLIGLLSMGSRKKRSSLLVSETLE